MRCEDRLYKRRVVARRKVFPSNSSNIADDISGMDQAVSVQIGPDRFNR